jgi:aryl-alcohol dehydrogenase-like predicted oxidoreductase
VKQGKVLYFGSSNFAGWHIAQANEAAKARGFLGLVCEQSKYHLLCRTPELEVIPSCRAYGLGLIPWSPLGGGILGGGVLKGEGMRRQEDWVRETIKESRGALQAYEKLCSKWKQKPADVALAWLLQNPVVTAPIIGPRTMEQLTASMGALAVKLDKKRMEQLDKIFPGPGGEAPEAYAW